MVGMYAIDKIFLASICAIISAMARIVDRDALVAGEAFAVSFAVPTGATAAEIVFSGGTTVPFILAEGVFTATITAATTQALDTDARYAVFVTDAAGRTCVERGEITVTRMTSRYREVLDAVRKAIANWGNNPNQSISVGEINISYKTLGDLLSLESHYRSLVEAEETGDADAASGGAFIMGTRFVQ